MQRDLRSTTAGELQKKVSGHFAHYSDEDADVEMSNCCVALENENDR